MLFFGWGRKSTQRQLSHSQVISMSWSSFHLFFLFALGWGKRYTLATLTEQGWAQREITETDAQQLLGFDLDIPLWNRFGLLITAAFLIVVIGGINLFAAMAG